MEKKSMSNCEPDAFEGLCMTHHQPIEKCWASQKTNPTTHLSSEDELGHALVTLWRELGYRTPKVKPKVLMFGDMMVIDIKQYRNELATREAEARIDELESFTHWYYFDRLDGKKLPIENYRDERLKALNTNNSEK